MRRRVSFRANGEGPLDGVRKEHEHHKGRDHHEVRGSENRDVSVSARPNGPGDVAVLAEVVVSSRIVSIVARFLIAGIALVWLILVATAMDDPLGIIGVVVVSSVAVAVVVLVVVVDSAVRAGRDLRGQS